MNRIVAAPAIAGAIAVSAMLLLGACATALLVAIVLRSRPIYGLLADRAANRT